jgi:hypothetical protein
MGFIAPEKNQAERFLNRGCKKANVLTPALPARILLLSPPKFSN